MEIWATPLHEGSPARNLDSTLVFNLYHILINLGLNWYKFLMKRGFGVLGLLTYALRKDSKNHE